MSGINYARVWTDLAAVDPAHAAVVSGNRHLTWGDFADRAHRLASALDAHGVRATDKVAICCVNRTEYLETFYAALLLGAVPVNVNYRYGVDELVYLLDNSEPVAVIHDAAFASSLREAAARAGVERYLLQTGADYERVLAEHEPTGDWSAREPDGDDLMFVYTGGTTGYPKAVMWRVDDMYRAVWAMARPGTPPPDAVEKARAGRRAGATLPASPLMHGTGLFSALAALAAGGTVVLLESAGLEPYVVWDACAAEHVSVLTIVGDVFARPLLAALDHDPNRWDLTSLKAITSSGVTWSPDVKRGLLHHLPDVLVIDTLGSSEGMASRAASAAGDAIVPARFDVSDRVQVFGDDDLPVVPGSGAIGLVAMGGHIPTGYWKDPTRSAETFRVIDGRRWSIPGDFARVEPDGAVTLLGRGSACINTGGEKVYPEEVEVRLRAHPDVDDVVVVGAPDDRLGETVVAIVALVAEPSELGSSSPGYTGSDETVSAALRRWCRATLAGYKCPTRVVVRPTLDRSAAGKADYGRLRAIASDAGGTRSDR